MKYLISIVFISTVLLVYQCKKDLDLEPAVKTGRIESVSTRSAIVHAEIIDIGNGISDYGHCYKELSTPTVSDRKTSFGSTKQLKEFHSELTELEAGTEYIVRAYVSTEDKTYYGSELTLVTNDGIAVLETGEVTNIRARSAHCEGFVISSGGDDIIEKGFCWSKNSELDLGSCSGRVSVNNDSESFQSELEGLKPGTRYFVNAYAITSVDTSYGISKEFVTRDGVLKFDDFVLKDSSISSLSIEFEILDNGGDSIEALGICWGESESPEIGDYSVVLGSDTGRYVYSILNLKQNTPYYIRPFGTNSVNTFYGSQLMHKTGAGLSVSTIPVFGIRMSSARTGGQIFGSEQATISERGVCWGLQEDPTLDENKIVSFDDSNIFSADLNGLESNTTYYVRAYVALGQVVIYGESHSFVTDDGEIDIQTYSPESITETTALLGGTVLDDGGDSVTARGVCWSIHENPSLSDNHTTDGSGTGGYTSALNGLSCGRHYYVRAYATNSAGTCYGEQQNVTTSDCPVELPIVTTTSVSNVTESTAQSGGNVTDDGGTTVTSKGVCWSTHQEPTLSDSYTTDGSGIGGYTSVLSELSCETTYYIRAYATNLAGTSYGDQVHLTTSDCPVELPEVTTTSVSNITENSAQCGGNVSNDGGAPVSAKGVCWSNHENPTLSDSYTTDGGGTAGFMSVLSGLSCETPYYVRAYATNSAGTSYGNQVEFSTSDCMSVTDFDGNSYQIIEIGDQTWMAENLKTTHYSDGTVIPLVEGVSAWEHLDDNERAYCFYENSVSNKDIYGALYTWAAAMNGSGSSDANPSGVQGVCPSGWHLPSESEYRVLVNALGDSSIVGGMLKQAGYTHWISPNLGATNETGYTALPAGYRDIYGEFTDKGLSVNLWSSKDNLEKYAWFRPLYFDGQAFYSFYWHKKNGFSVRCVKNE